MLSKRFWNRKDTKIDAIYQAKSFNCKVFATFCKQLDYKPENGKPSAVLLSLDEYESLKENLLIRSDTDLMVEIKEGIENLKKSRQLYTLQELFEVKKRFNQKPASELETKNTGGLIRNSRRSKSRETIKI